MLFINGLHPDHRSFKHYLSIRKKNVCHKINKSLFNLDITLLSSILHIISGPQTKFLIKICFWCLSQLGYTRLCKGKRSSVGYTVRIELRWLKHPAGSRNRDKSYLLLFVKKDTYGWWWWLEIEISESTHHSNDDYIKIDSC